MNLKKSDAGKANVFFLFKKRKFVPCVKFFEICVLTLMKIWWLKAKPLKYLIAFASDMNVTR